MRNTLLVTSLHGGVLAPQAELHAVPEADVDAVRLADAPLRHGHALEVAPQRRIDVAGLEGLPAWLDSVVKMHCCTFQHFLWELPRALKNF